MRRIGLAAAATAFLACSQLPGRPPMVPRGGGPESAQPTAAKSLYRVRYGGPEGSGSLRLVLRQVAADRFQLQASDTFGRAVWDLDLDGDDVLLVDHRAREACTAAGELRIPELALRPLPLPALARVLGGLTPLAPPDGADPADWTDTTGQRWTARWEEERLVAWTMWEAGEPRLWWSRLSDGGVLSHRGGSQFRWRRVTRESLEAASYRRIEAPAEYALGNCGTGGRGS